MIKHIERLKQELIEISEMQNNKPIIPICVDFDGTVVTHEYPLIGQENDNCSEILKRWINEYNVGIILDTMRSGDTLKEAIKWFEERGVPLYGIGKHPTQNKWTESNKSYGIFSIDDRNVGVPMKYDLGIGRVDWQRVCDILEPKLKELNK